MAKKLIGSWPILILLFVCFWPGALIYLFVNYKEVGPTPGQMQANLQAQYGPQMPYPSMQYPAQQAPPPAAPYPSHSPSPSPPPPHTSSPARNIDIGPVPTLERAPASIENTIPDYTISHKLGSGGFATVYKAKDIGGRDVAIKMPRFLEETLDSSIYEKFESEANMWKMLKHKNIVEFYCSILDPYPALVMELMEGGSLKGLMRYRRLTTHEALSIFIQLVDAISYAHRMASIHRDIKPENILFTKDGIPKLTDWGIGKFMASESATKTVGAKGTLAYSAPEQVSRKKFGEVDWSTDIFQIAVVGYEILTGINPFMEDDPVGIMGKIINDDVTPPSHLNPEISPRVDTVILKALEKRKEDRWRSADVMYDRLRAAGGY